MFLAPAVLLLGFIFDAARAASTGNEARLWPLPIKINLTSSFGEYRSGHLHAGLDIKTYGRQGVPCLAVGDGHVSRMRAAPDGYGKAIYLKLVSGETVVYSHLSEFTPVLEEALHQEQIKAGRYRVDSYFEPGHFPFRRGDTIGYTGRTGASAPHLHFEVRDAAENPMNPLAHGWELTDESRPNFKAAVFIPLSVESRVGGLCRAQDITLREVAAGRYVAADTVAVSGQVGLGVQIIDRINSSSGRLAPYRVELTVDGALLASIKMEKFTYSHTGEVELAYEMDRVRRRGDHYLLTFRRNGESLWNRQFVNDGVIDTELLPRLVGSEKGVYNVVLRATDMAGNVSAAMIPFFVGASKPSGATFAAASETTETDEVPGCYFFEDLMSVQPSMVQVLASNNNHNPTATGRDQSQWVFEVGDFSNDPPFTGVASDIVLEGHGARTHILPVRKGELTTKRLRTLGVDVVTDEKSLYADAFIFVKRWEGQVDETTAHENGLGPVGAPIRLGPSSLAFRRSVQIRSTGRGPADGREAFYMLDERKNNWSYASSEVLGDTVVANVRSPGVYAVFVDTVPPTVSRAAVRERRSYATHAVTLEIVIRIEDKGSGVDADRTEVFVDGIRRIARWDGFVDKMFVGLSGAEAAGARNVSVVAFDRVGNEARIESRVQLEDPGSKD